MIMEIIEKIVNASSKTMVIIVLLLFTKILAIVEINRPVITSSYKLMT